MLYTVPKKASRLSKRGHSDIDQLKLWLKKSWGKSEMYLMHIAKYYFFNWNQMVFELLPKNPKALNKQNSFRVMKFWVCDDLWVLTYSSFNNDRAGFILLKKCAMYLQVGIAMWSSSLRCWSSQNISYLLLLCAFSNWNFICLSPIFAVQIVTTLEILQVVVVLSKSSDIMLG